MLSVSSTSNDISHEYYDDQKGQGNADSDGDNIIRGIVTVKWSLKCNQKINDLLSI